MRNIEIGITSVSSVNAYKAIEIGSNILQAMIGKNIFDYSFKKSSQAVTPTTTPTVTLDGETVHVDPQLDLQQQPSDQLKTFHKFLIMNYVVFHPHYLIQLDSSEKHNSQPWQMPFGYLETAAVLNHLEMTQFVLDGGSLLQRIPWSKGTPFATIWNYYVNYVTEKYYDAIVVFYGYRSGPTTKDTRIQHTCIAPKESPVRKYTLHKILHSKLRRNSFCPIMTAN